MIATVTMNPAVDYTVLLESPLMHNDVNRTSHERITAGGKGVNVSLILQQLEIPTTVYGYLSGTDDPFLPAPFAQPSCLLHVHTLASFPLRRMIESYSEVPCHQITSPLWNRNMLLPSRM